MNSKTTVSFVKHACFPIEYSQLCRPSARPSAVTGTGSHHTLDQPPSHLVFYSYLSHTPGETWVSSNQCLQLHKGSVYSFLLLLPHLQPLPNTLCPLEQLEEKLIYSSISSWTWSLSSRCHWKLAFFWQHSIPRSSLKRWLFFLPHLS